MSHPENDKYFESQHENNIAEVKSGIALIIDAVERAKRLDCEYKQGLYKGLIEEFPELTGLFEKYEEKPSCKGCSKYSDIDAACDWCLENSDTPELERPVCKWCGICNWCRGIE